MNWWEDPRRQKDAVLSASSPKNMVKTVLFTHEHAPGLVKYNREFGQWASQPAAVRLLGLSEIAAATQHGLAGWRSFGFPVFRLTADLTAGLALTAPDPMAPWPFTAFVCVPSRGFWNNVSYILMHAPTGPEGVAVHTIIFQLDGTQLFTYRLQTDFFNPAVETETIADPAGMTPDAEETMIQRAVTRCAINLCAYVSEVGMGRSQRSYSNRKRDRRSQARKDRPEVWILGKEIKLDARLVESAQQCETRAGWKVATRFCVRGHWRNQACGVERKERKRIWIHPHWRGPEDGPKVSHVFSKRDETKCNQ